MANITDAAGHGPEGTKSTGGQVAAAGGSYVRNGKRVRASGGGAGDGGGKGLWARGLTAAHVDEDVRVYVGDCRDVLAVLPEAVEKRVDLVFADPPFNWKRGYDLWKDSLTPQAYWEFTERWLALSIAALRPGGALWVNIPDDWAAEIVVYLKKVGMTMRNWCIWHYRFGQNTTERFINSKVHALYFVKPGGLATWDANAVLELSDRATTYFDPRTLSKKDGMPAGKRVPLDVWYGKYFGRVQGNSKERRNYHDNQLPEAYLHRVISCSSRAGDLVLDPFLGSGTTGVMAKALKRKFVGIEYSAVNAANAYARIEAGPVRAYDEAVGSAIFKPRKAGPLSLTKMAAGIKES